MQEILIMTTEKRDMRAEVVGWSSADGNCVSAAFCSRIGTKNEYASRNDIPVGLCGGMMYHPPSYPTVLHAIGQGWKLLAPPVEYMETGNDGMTKENYEWWLVRD
jgi:hypothetical protein